MSGQAMTDEEWVAAHIESSKDLFRQQLAAAIGVHWPLIGEPYAMTRQDLSDALIVAAAVVLIAPEGAL